MRPRQIIFPLVAIALAIGMWWCSRPVNDRPDAAPRKSGKIITAQPATRPVPSAGNSALSPAAGAGNENAFPLAAALNAPGGTVAGDLEIVSHILDAWRTNFPQEGNPVGENHEITAALLGANRLEFALLPRNHPAINERGELCDRWGTPFRFHQLSGERMEIRSAGPDRKFGTADDARWSPGS